MLKRFLKFFKNSESTEMPEFEGSYLDFLLEQIEPQVTAELEACEAHDPLLLVIVEILRTSMRGVWSPETTRPLTDQHTPHAQQRQGTAAPPPPPPAPPRPVPADETNELDLVDDAIPSDEVIDDLAEAEQVQSYDPAVDVDAELIEESRLSDPDEELPPPAPPAADDAPSEDAEDEEDVEDIEDEAHAEDEAGEDSDDAAVHEPHEDDDAPDDGADTIEEDAPAPDDDDEHVEEVEEILTEDSELIEEIVEEERTAEYVGTVDEDDGETTAEFDVEDVQASQAPRADRKEVLQAGRVFLGMLIENDRLPFELQLGMEETLLARDLLVGYFVGNEDFEDKAQQLLRIVEQKFGEGRFSQARILLQLFQTDPQRRIKHDRNIFYEDMIQRLGIRRRNPVATETLKEFKAFTGTLVELMRWLEETLFIKFHMFTRQPETAKKWRDIGDLSSIDGSTEYLLRFLPPRRWRALYRKSDADDATLRAQLAEHICNETLATYVTNQLRTCYFVLRAVGDTGLEGYLDTFFEWTRDALDVNATSLLPEIYRRSMGENDMMKTIFTDLYNRSLRGPSEQFLDGVSDDVIEEALDEAIAFIRACNLNEVPPGNYDLGGFVYDKLFGVVYPKPEFAFKLHRLT